MIYTAGIFLINKNNELLIAHPTNAPHDKWSIPKGIIEDNESVIDAATRELFEETNIFLDNYKPVYILTGENVPYSNKKKTLCPVYVKILTDLSDVNLRCNSYVDIVGQKPFLENDKIEWVKISDALILIHPTQVIAYNQMKFK